MTRNLLFLSACLLGAVGSFANVPTAGAQSVQTSKVQAVAKVAQCETDRAQAFVVAAATTGVPAPTTLDEMNRYSLPYRRAWMRTMPQAALGRLWVEQLSRSLASDESLTREQRSMLALLVKKMPAMFTDSAGRAHLSALEPTLRNLFGKEKAIALFYQLGSDDPNTVARKAVSRRVAMVPRFVPASWVTKAVKVGVFGSNQQADCNCANGDCGSGVCAGGTGCLQWNWGCGFLGWRQCTGICQSHWL